MKRGSEFRIIKKLGEGSFADVFMAQSNKTGEMFAIKRLKKKCKTVENVNHLSEINSLQILQGHPNIIELRNLFYDSKSGYVSMFFELMDLNVYELITEHKKPFDERTSLILVYQILQAISYIHSKNMFHRDIKPENCMVNRKTMTLKLCDFGSTRNYSDSQPYTEYVATRWYRAPECILTSGSYGPKVDEWAVGCMLYELLTTRPLFPGKNEIDQISKIHNIIGTPSRDTLATFKKNPNTQIRFSFPQRESQDLHRFLPYTSDETIDLITALLTYNEEDRISAEEALLLPAFEEIRDYEEQWINETDQDIPFPLYFLHKGNVLIEPTIEPYKTNKVYQMIKDQNQYPQHQKIYQSPGAIVTHHKFPEHTSTLLQKQAQTIKPNANYQQQFNSQMANTQINPKYQFGLIESRIKAAQRISEYKSKQMKMFQKVQPVNKNVLHFGPTKINTFYQKPKADLIHPRLPKIVI